MTIKNKVPLSAASPYERRCLWCKQSLIKGILDPKHSVITCMCGLKYTTEILQELSERDWFEILEEDLYEIHRTDDELYIRSRND